MNFVLAILHLKCKITTNGGISDGDKIHRTDVGAGHSEGCSGVSRGRAHRPKAVGEDDQGRFVFVVEPTGDDVAEVRKQPVTIGRLTAEGFEILEGLTAGQRVATAGLQTLLDGQRVRLR